MKPEINLREFVYSSFVDLLFQSQLFEFNIVKYSKEEI